MRSLSIVGDATRLIVGDATRLIVGDATRLIVGDATRLKKNFSLHVSGFSIDMFALR